MFMQRANKLGMTQGPIPVIKTKEVQVLPKPAKTRIITQNLDQHAKMGNLGEKQVVESFFLKLYNTSTDTTSPLLSINISNAFPNQKRRLLRIEQAYFYVEVNSLNQLPVSFCIAAANCSGFKINQGSTIVGTDFVAFLQPIQIQEMVSPTTGQTYYNVLYATKIPFTWSIGQLMNTNFRFWAQTQSPPTPDELTQVITSYKQYPITACPLTFKFDIVHLRP